MTITLKELAKLQPVDKVIIQSLDLALYSLSVEHNGQRHALVDNQGQMLKLHNLMTARELLSQYAIKEMVMQHSSAYDEMVGQPVGNGNLLEVQISTDLYPTPKTLN